MIALRVDGNPAELAEKGEALVKALADRLGAPIHVGCCGDGNERYDLLRKALSPQPEDHGEGGIACLAVVQVRDGLVERYGARVRLMMADLERAMEGFV